MVRKSVIGSFLALSLWGFSACSTPIQGDMPSYNAETVNAHYSTILEHEAMYYQLMSLMAAGYIPENRTTQASTALDKYIYWSSIAKIHVFHGRWKESDEASAKARDGLDQIIKILMTDAI